MTQAKKTNIVHITSRNGYESAITGSSFQIQFAEPPARPGESASPGSRSPG
jgi:hypothetical protein